MRFALSARPSGWYSLLELAVAIDLTKPEHFARCKRGRRWSSGTWCHLYKIAQIFCRRRCSSRALCAWYLSHASLPIDWSLSHTTTSSLSRSRVAFCSADPAVCAPKMAHCRPEVRVDAWQELVAALLSFPLLLLLLIDGVSQRFIARDCTLTCMQSHLHMDVGQQ